MRAKTKLHLGFLRAPGKQKKKSKEEGSRRKEKKKNLILHILLAVESIRA